MPHLIDQSLTYSPDLVPCDFYLFGKLYLSMKGKCYAGVKTNQKACTNILEGIPKDNLKKMF